MSEEAPERAEWYAQDRREAAADALDVARRLFVNEWEYGATVRYRNLVIMRTGLPEKSFQIHAADGGEGSDQLDILLPFGFGSVSDIAIRLEEYARIIENGAGEETPELSEPPGNGGAYQ